MKVINYIRQFPGLENWEARNVVTCPKDFGLEQQCGAGAGPCGECEDREATINGNPAPFIFTCPVKSGQTIYKATTGFVFEETVIEVRFRESGWTAIASYKDLSSYAFNADSWMVNTFPTAEQAWAFARGE